MPSACVRIDLTSSRIGIVRIAANSVENRPLCESGRPQGSMRIRRNFSESVFRATSAGRTALFVVRFLLTLKPSRYGVRIIVL